jgi:hypothetical protein
MTNRALRNRVVELEADTDMSGVYEEDLASGQENSVEETSAVMNLRQDELRIGQSEKETVSTEREKSACEVNVTEQASVEVPSNNAVTMPSNLQDMFDSMLASLKSDQLQMIATLHESFKGEISAFKNEIKEDIRLEFKRFERENQKLRQELTEKLSSETDKFSHLLRQVQDDTESELVAVKRNFQVMGTEFDAKLGQQAKNTSRIADELASKIVQNREQVTEQISKLSEEINTVKSNLTKDEEIFQKGQGERLEHVLQVVEREKSVNKRNFEELKSAISNLKGKTPVSPTAACSVEMSQPSESSFVPATLTVSASDDGTDSNHGNGNVVCSGNHVSCDVCMNGGVSDQNVPVSVRPHSANSYLSQTDSSLPIFDDSSEVNAMSHLNQLDELMRLRAVPKQVQLAIACKSIVDSVGKQWLAAILYTPTNYEQSKTAFAKDNWSQSHQNLVKCSIYQDKYYRQSNLTMSSHFIKYAVLASYLDLKLGDGELIDALSSHFPSYAQRDTATQ